jgi:hypothetical protein
MKNHLLTFAILALALANPARAQQSSGVPVHIVVTVEAHKGKEPPVINREDVMVHEGRDRDPVVDWVPAQGEHAALELMILLDDGSNTTLGTQLDYLRNFISSQPDTTTVGVAYMRDGVAQVVQNLTSDHSLAAKALRLPLGIRGVNASPYLSLTDLVKRWPTTPTRRAVIVATDGVDLYGTETCRTRTSMKRSTTPCAPASQFRRYTRRRTFRSQLLADVLGPDISVATSG